MSDTKQDGGIDNTGDSEMSIQQAKKSFPEDGLTVQASIANGIVENHDDFALRLQGHEAVLERQFGFWSALGLAFSVTGSWVGYLSCFGQNLLYGGPQAVIFALLVSTFVQGFITLGLSEIASAFPSTGGQYHYVYLLAPARFKHVMAFFTAWFSVLGWWIITCSGHLLVAVSLAGMANFWHPEYVAERWHIYLMYVATAFVTAAPVFLCPKRISWFTEACLYMSLLGCLVVLIMALAMHQKFYPSSQITDSGMGNSGWSDSLAWVLAVGNAMYAYVGTDAASHVAEEIRHPNKLVPWIMNGSIIIGFFTVFPLMLVLMYAMSDMDAVASSALPAMELFLQVTGSKVASTFMMAWITVIYISSLNSQWVTSGRIAWALARDGGLPFSKYFSKIDERGGFPLRTTVLAMFFICLYGLIYLASSNAFNSIVTSAVLYLNISYAIPQAILVFHGRDLLPKRYYNLGNMLGMFCNVFSPLAVIALIVLFSFPATNPTTIGSMNYSSVVLVGLLLVLTGMWYWIGHSFEGPKATLEQIRLSNGEGDVAEGK